MEYLKRRATSIAFAGGFLLIGALTYYLHVASGAARSLPRHVDFSTANPLPFLVIPAVVASYLFLRYFKWVFLLRALNILAPLRDLLFSYYGSAIGHFFPFFPLILLRILPIQRRALGLLVLGLDVLTDVAAIVALSAYPAGVTWLASMGLMATMMLTIPFWPPKAPDNPNAGVIAFSVILAAAFSVSVTALSAFGLGFSFWTANIDVGFATSIRILAETRFAEITSLLRFDLIGFASAMPEVLPKYVFAPSKDTLSLFATHRAIAMYSTLAFSVAAVVVYALHSVTKRKAADHFDLVAHRYESSLSEHMADYLTDKKYAITLRHLPLESFRRGLDIGCGQGSFLQKMLTEGYDMSGIDSSESQIAYAKSRLGDDADRVRTASFLELPFEDESFEFLYTINTMHHLPSYEAQAVAMNEALRVLKPGGRLIVHDMHVQNPVFRMYISYFFPLIKNIDVGTEIWVKPDDTRVFGRFEPIATYFFTFLPDFLPHGLFKHLVSIEDFLAANPWTRSYAAHFSSVLEKPETTAAWQSPGRLDVGATGCSGCVSV